MKTLPRSVECKCGGIAVRQRDLFGDATPDYLCPRCDAIIRVAPPKEPWPDLFLFLGELAACVSQMDRQISAGANPELHSALSSIVAGANLARDVLAAGNPKPAPKKYPRSKPVPRDACPLCHARSDTYHRKHCPRYKPRKYKRKAV